MYILLVTFCTFSREIYPNWFILQTWSKAHIPHHPAHTTPHHPDEKFPNLVLPHSLVFTWQILFLKRSPWKSAQNGKHFQRVKKSQNFIFLFQMILKNQQKWKKSLKRIRKFLKRYWPTHLPSAPHPLQGSSLSLRTLSSSGDIIDSRCLSVGRCLL